MAATRSAHATWKGSLLDGHGSVSGTSSRTFEELPITWAARTEEPDGRTSPEELLAAAQAACFAMALSNILHEKGHDPIVLEVTARATFVPGEGVTAIEIDVAGSAGGLDAEAFDAVVQEAEHACPISNALRGNVDVTVRSELRGDLAGSASPDEAN